ICPCAIMFALVAFCLSSCSKSADIADDIPPDEPVSIVISAITVDGIEAVQPNDSTFYVRLPYGADTKSLPVVFDTESTILAGGVTDPSAVDLSNPLILISSNGEESRQYSLIACFSDLPVVYVNASGPVLNKTDWVKKSTMQVANAGPHDAVYSMSIRGRGNSTWEYPKKPFAIKLDGKAEVLGMPKHKRWCLLANWMDRTNIRNDVAFRIADVMTGLEWTPKGRFVDLVYNGEFVGNYYLCEQIKVDKHRVNIDELDLADIDGVSLTGGYLLEFDEYFDEDYKFMTDRLKLPVNLKSPDEDVPDAQMNYIQSYVNEVEQKLAAKAPYTEIETLIDIDSYIDWWLVYELVVCDEPNHPKSAYMYKKRGGKLYAGPVWDFDWGTFRNPARWVDRYSIWYRYLFNYKEFKSRLKERWAGHRKALGEIPEYIDSLQRAIAASCDYDCALWPLEGLSSINADENLSFAESVALLKENYLKRLEWMDVNIEKF
ncbi:MAG: CotH kinase family protein, partial [Muribaculaceae bacterium]|nr:CotH kinase family protein [Muribaculaceae bacterium]